MPTLKRTASAVTCTRRGCGARTEERIDHVGRVSFVCRPCERNKAGRCRDCPATLASNRCLRCNDCAVDRRRALDNALHKRRYVSDPEFRKREIEKKRRARHDPAKNAKQRAYYRTYHAAHPKKRDDLDRLYLRLWYRQARANPKKRERLNAHRRAYDAIPEVRERKAAQRRALFNKPGARERHNACQRERNRARKLKRSAMQAAA